MGASMRPERDPLDDEFEQWKKQQKTAQPSTAETVGGAAIAATQGGMYGFAEEAAARSVDLVRRLSGGKLFGGAKYETMRDDVRAREKAFRDQNAPAAMVAEVAGALATPHAAPLKIAREAAAAVPLLKGIRTAGSATRFGRAARAAIGMGADAALAGAGAGEGSAAARAGAAATSAGAGAVTGGVFKGAGKAGGYVYDAARSTAPGRFLSRATGNKLFLTAEERAAQKLTQRMADGGVTLDAARDAASTATKPMTLTEIGGDNVAGLVRGARAVPGAQKQVINDRLTQRMQGAEERVLGDILETTGVGRHSMAQARDAFVREREAAAGPMFQKMEEHYGPVHLAKLDELLDRPSMQSAVTETEAILREQARRVPGETFQPLTRKVKVDTPDGVKEVTQLRPVTFREASLLKQSLDDVSDVAKVPNPLDAGGVSKTRRAKMTNTLAEVRDVLDEAFAGDEALGVPSYKASRDAFAGPTAMARAYEEGQQLFKQTPDQISETLADMSQSERAAWRKAAVEALAQRVETISQGRDIATNLEGKTLDRKRLRLIFGDGEAGDAAFNAFRARLGEEAKMHRGRLFVQGNSQTADKLAEIADLADVPLLDAAGAAASGNLAGAAMATGRFLAKTGRGVEMGARAEKIADFATRGATGGPADLQAVIEELSRLGESARKKAARGATGRGKASRVVGGRAGAEK